ncbi:hypothetical protein [Vibrio parahaemolyticus]|uniref:hypothetical protein n=1 Tax=Vibrio parahaemolyticus TaxID=670 RepID=UPI0022698787|nr:hypothetical protein [Vibrio parahaemolyticus]MCX8905673.1 hypothetical protein [Vibrio parahaemolyticus]
MPAPLNAALTVKEEIGIIDVIIKKLKSKISIASIGLLVAILTYFQGVSSSKEAIIVDGSGTPKVDTYLVKEQCYLLATIPLSYNNSGDLATTLTKFNYAQGDQPFLYFVKGQEEFTKKDMVYYSYLTPYELSWHVPKWLDALSLNGVDFEPNFDRYLNKLIPVGETYHTNVALLVPISSKRSHVADFIAVSFNAIFENGQELPYSGSIDLPMSVGCDG